MLEYQLSGPTSRPDNRPRCVACGGPGKLVIPPSVARPHFYHADDGEWFTFVLCIDCGTYWVQAPYEPYASFIYAIYWPYTREFWCYVGKLEGSAIIARWCAYKIRQAWPTMSEQDRLAVQNHRHRILGRNPIDEAPEETDPLAPYLASQQTEAPE
jgi:hypothetical protein